LVRAKQLFLLCVLLIIEFSQRPDITFSCEHFLVVLWQETGSNFANPVKTFLQLVLSLPVVCVSVLVFMVTRKDGFMYLIGEPVIESAETEQISLTEQDGQF